MKIFSPIIKLCSWQRVIHRRKPEPNCTIYFQVWLRLNKRVFLGISLFVLINAENGLWVDFKNLFYY